MQVYVCPKIIHYGHEMEFPMPFIAEVNVPYVVKVGVVKDGEKNNME